MLRERNIIYFTPFYFKNGSAPQNKFFVVLKINDCIVLASLPTSKDHVPVEHFIEDGCVELAHANFNCFIISPQTKITECEKCFEVFTFIYGHLIDDFTIQEIKAQYQLEGINYHVFGKMREDIYKDLISCLKNSNSVKIKYLKML
jgi:hypothetical protein